MTYTPVDLVEVRAWSDTVGAVTLDPATGFAVFEYASDWIASGPQLAPMTMPNRAGTFTFRNLATSTYHGLPGLLADALPDAFGNAVIDAWMAQHGIDKTDFTTLDRLAYAGERALGALTFHPPAFDDAFVVASALQVADIVQAARDVISGRIDDVNTLNQLINVGSSAGGARAKAIVNFNPRTMQVRSGHTPAEDGFTPWLMKLDGVTGTADGKEVGGTAQYTRIEYGYHLMALDAGLAMSECLLLPEGPRAHFLTKRFDRDIHTGERIHMQTLCGLAHLDFGLLHAHSYEQYFNTVTTLNLGTEALGQAFRRMVFNIAAVNRDDHTKNLSFLLPRNGRWQLAPAYDVTFAHNPDGPWTAQHQLSVNGKFSGITVADLELVGDKFAVPGYKTIIKDVLNVVKGWPGYAASADVSPEAIHRINATLAEFRLGA